MINRKVRQVINWRTYSNWLETLGPFPLIQCEGDFLLPLLSWPPSPPLSPLNFQFCNLLQPLCPGLTAANIFKLVMSAMLEQQSCRSPKMQRIAASGCMADAPLKGYLTKQYMAGRGTSTIDHQHMQGLVECRAGRNTTMHKH